MKRVWILPWVLLVLIETTACTRDRTQESISIDLVSARVNDLEISVGASDTRMPWTARFSRSPNGTWLIAAPPGELTIKDRIARTERLDLILSSLGSLRIQGLAPAATLESMGLSPPRYMLRWTDGGQTHELTIGAPIGKLGTAIRWKNEVRLAAGSLLGILAESADFNELRRQQIATWTPDDVAEFEILRSGKGAFYAQRLSGDWGDRNEKPVQTKKLTPWLKDILSLRAIEIADGLKAPQSDAPVIVFRDRRGREVGTLQLLRFGNKSYVRVSTRPDALFLISENAISSFYP